MQQDDEAASATTLGVMQAHAADLRVAVPDRRIEIYQRVSHSKTVASYK